MSGWALWALLGAGLAAYLAAVIVALCWLGALPPVAPAGDGEDGSDG